ncbi:MAG: cytochrome b N-terminal domain-containing protein [Chloroflexota bacterium]|nr:cytochrome b N-terminal domain-containing protein [Chloroflexota bacterium]
MVENILTWLEERLGLEAIYETVLNRKVPKVNWWFTLGSASLFLCVMQVVTGIFLTMYYVPSPDAAYDSIQYIMNEVAFGWLVRGIHHWSASLLVITLLLHLLRTFFYGAYKYPREMTWVTGVLLFILTLGMGLTGYLLPWNQRAYWATTVATEIFGTVPFIGDFLFRVLRGGTDLSAITLVRFFSAHIWILPAAVVMVLGTHLYLIVNLGISNIPGEDE